MNVKIWIEAFGYLGSALVVISMLMTSVLKLRIINMIGSIIFAVYALIIRSYPTALMNFFLVGINIYHLMRLRNTNAHYDLVDSTIQKGYVEYLLQYYGDDIRSYFPSVGQESGRADTVCLVCCDSAPAGIFMGEKEADGGMHILLDYSTPVYRDCSVGTFLYEKLCEKGIRRLRYTGNVPEHVAYVRKMGYSRQPDGSYVKDLQ